MKRLLTDADVVRAHARGERVVDAPSADVVVTPSAWTKARELGVGIATGTDAGPARRRRREEPAVAASSSTPRTRPGGEGAAERAVDASGVVVVRGKSVQLGAFPAAGAGRDVRLLDVVTGKDRAPMTAGFMSWSRADSFPWRLDYDEIDYVVEGVLEVTIDGRTVRATAGDVVYIPKGSAIVFGTPSRVRVFYVTYPADWSAAPSQS